MNVNERAAVQAAAQMQADAQAEADGGFDFEGFFHAHYARAARTVARVTGDFARAEDIASEAFWKLWRTPRARGEAAAGWLYRSLVRLALNELRSRRRRERYEAQSDPAETALTPEQSHALAEERRRVRAVLAVLAPRDAELLLLRAAGFRYRESAAALEINPASVGTLLARAQRAFREEYVRRYGEPDVRR